MRCAVYGCNECTPYKSGEIVDSKISFHVFPRNKKLCKQWVLLCRRKDQINTKNARICSKHFKMNDFIAPNPVFAQHGIQIKAQIKRDIAPSLFLPMQRQLNLSTPRNVRSLKRISAKNLETIVAEYHSEYTPNCSGSSVIKVESPGQTMVTAPEPNPVGKIGSSTQTEPEIAGKSKCLNLSTPRNVRSPKRISAKNLETIDAEHHSEYTPNCSGSSVIKVESPGQTMVIAPEPNPVGKIDCSTQTDPNVIPYSQLQEEVIQLRQKCWKQQQTINSIGHIFTKDQIQKLECPEKRGKWTSDDISNSITIYAAGPRAYRLLLKKKYPLPAVITLKKWCAKIKHANTSTVAINRKKQRKSNKTTL